MCLRSGSGGGDTQVPALQVMSAIWLRSLPRDQSEFLLKYWSTCLAGPELGEGCGDVVLAYKVLTARFGSRSKF